MSNSSSASVLLTPSFGMIGCTVTCQRLTCMCWLTGCYNDLGCAVIIAHFIFTKLTVLHCSSLFRTVFFKFLCNFTLAKNKIKSYNFVYCRVRHRFVLFQTSCVSRRWKIAIEIHCRANSISCFTEIRKKEQWPTVRWKYYPIEIYCRANNSCCDRTISR